MVDYLPKEGNHYSIPIDKNVYEAAKERIKEIIELVDECIVSFSGGKDSLVVLNLVQECYDEMGIEKKLKVFFFDEEIIPDCVIDFVTEIYKSGKYDFTYWAIPLKSTKGLLGKAYDYVQWDKDREWIRQPPDFAKTLGDDEYFVYSQYNRNSYVCKDIPGKICMFNGMRASESLNRQRAVNAKPYKTYINHDPKDKRIITSKPIYDWDERDVFLYFLKNDINYCIQYDKQMYNRENLRVATAIYDDSSVNFYKVKTANPEFYDRVVKVFPEMKLQDRYYRELDRTQSFKYPHTVRGLLSYIDDEITDPNQKKLAKKMVKTALTTRRNKIREGSNLPLGGYPLKHLFECISIGAYKRGIMHKMNYDVEDYLFEGKTREDYKKDLNKAKAEGYAYVD